MDNKIEEFLTTIVENVKIERKKRDISQLKLANILGFQSPNYIAKIETRKHGVSYNISHLYQIATVFEMEVIDLIPLILTPPNLPSTLDDKNTIDGHKK